MTTSLAYQAPTPARHKTAHSPAREKIHPRTPEKSQFSRRPPLFFIGGIETASNASFFPSIPPSLRLLFGSAIATLSRHMNIDPPRIPLRTDGTQIWGRGACDTRNNIASMLKPAERLLCAGKCNFGPLFVCEERNSAAVIAAANTPRGHPYEEAMYKPKPQETSKTLRPPFPFAGVTKVEAITEK